MCCLNGLEVWAGLDKEMKRRRGPWGRTFQGDEMV
jgi:hypothetical protein